MVYLYDVMTSPLIVFDICMVYFMAGMAQTPCLGWFISIVPAFVTSSAPVVFNSNPNPMAARDRKACPVTTV